MTLPQAAGFQVLLTTDKNIRYQQNLARKRIAIIVLGRPEWPVLRLHLERVVTDHPTAAWTAQQLREAFPWDCAPRYLLWDRDHAFDGWAETGQRRTSRNC